MVTYQDLLELGENERDRMNFVLDAISKHQSTLEYRVATEAELYYNGENPTINKYEKIIYDTMGRAHADMWTANHKIASSFYTFAVDQEVSYLLGNGVTFGKAETKNKLGLNFDESVQDALEYCRIAGTAFGFWNYDHLDIFSFTEFVPLYDEETGALMAGIRFWQLDAQKPMRATLYEIDGYTEYIKRTGEDITVLKEKQSYLSKVVSSPAGGTEITDGGNYEGFPIVPMYSDKQHKSSLVGKRNTIDALDLACSNMVNNVDEGNLIYWVLTNCGGMDDLDDAKFVERLKTLRVAHAEGDSGAKAEAKTVEAPFEGTSATIDMLTRRLYNDFQAFDSTAVTAGNQTATAIQASYVPLDLKCDKIEREVTRFINGILALAGIDDKPTYQRNQLINKLEETQLLVMQAPYFDAEYIRKKLLALNGDVDLFEEISQRIDSDDIDRINDVDADQEDENATDGNLT